ncbi:nuclear transport factor 2 family protein [Chryseobacterium camelliae]|uniref:Nuclear transport factor 2 family protein n=1 Tax=Chryseobacterium camelliae TaxID=1265445 RepID=A0ABY7QQ81_9FLAO|nr:nuclear transport factor 2 family protein [Chryseobacterium camelliae]WBV61819.1 nuclear transport factor 2 family protein [Chryseobacterium camelliae]
MKTSVITIILFLICFKSLAQSSFETPLLKEQIRKLELSHAKAIFEGNTVALDSLMNDDVTVNHPTNRIVKEKKELLNLIKKGTIKYTEFERIPETFLFYKDMVVVMGKETVIPAKGAPNSGKKLLRRYTNVWMINNGKWQLFVRHANNICSE